MDCGGDRLCRGMRKEAATLVKKAVVRPDDGMRSASAQTNNQPRLDDDQFRLEPWLAGSYLGGRWFLVYSSLAALFELKMFHGVGDVDVRPFDCRIGEGAVEKRTRRADEGAASQILSIARLLSDKHNPRGDRTFSKNRLRGCAIQIAAFTVLSGVQQLPQATGFRDEAFSTGLFRDLGHIAYAANKRPVAGLPLRPRTN